MQRKIVKNAQKVSPGFESGKELNETTKERPDNLDEMPKISRGKNVG